MTHPHLPRINPRLILVLLGVVFLSGAIISTALYFGGWRPKQTKNHGELVQPALPTVDVPLTTLDGAPVAFHSLKGKWSLLYFGTADCPKPCQENLYKMRQIIAAQGKEAGRVRQVFIVTDAPAPEALKRTQMENPALLTMTGKPDRMSALAAQFQLPAGTPLDGLYRIYVMDPLGNFMMSYPPDADARKMRKDLTLLLKVSQIG